MKRTFNKKRLRSRDLMELDITSLLDILVILLVFLLKSYNASDLKLNLVKNLTLPNSSTRSLGNQNITIQVNNDNNIFINNKLIQKVQENDSLLEKTLKSHFNLKNKKINLVFHKDLNYKTIKRIMHISANSGFKEFKLIVKGNY